MTDAERQRKRRERLRQERGPVDRSPAAIIDALRKDNTDLRRQLANVVKAAPASDELASARGVIERLRQQVNALKAEIAAKPKPPKPSKPAPMAFKTMSVIVKALQPGSTKAERDDGIKAFNAWKADSKDATQRPPGRKW
jgi:hypothetical protein